MKRIITFFCLSLILLCSVRDLYAGDILYYSIGKKVTSSSTSTATYASTSTDTLPLMPPPPPHHKENAPKPPEAVTASSSEKSHFDSIHAGVESALDMLIKAKAKYKAKEITQEDYIKVADLVADYASIEKQRTAP